MYGFSLFLLSSDAEKFLELSDRVGSWLNKKVWGGS